MRNMEVSIDKKTVVGPEAATILHALRRGGVDTPTLCFADNLTPVNACRVCVVELEGARTLVPACSRKVEPKMAVATDSERVRTSRKLVLELLASSADVSTAPGFNRMMERYGSRADRFGPAAPHSPEGERG